MRRKICIVTGTRAEWGLLSPLAKFIKADADLCLQIIATNMHLSERYGLTYLEIEADGFEIDYRVPMDMDEDSHKDTVSSMAVGMSGFANAYEQLRPDMVVVLGDRYEILVAVSAALIFRIPVAHLHGGEITEGAFDDAIRHAITKMSHLHFTSTEEYRQRVIQMGEQPDRVFYVGAIGVDNITKLPLMNKGEIEESLGGIVLNKETILVTYHPVTLGQETPEDQINELLRALDNVPQLQVIFTMPNSDTGNHIIAHKISQWCDENGHRAVRFNSLGLKKYLSTLQYIGAVVGNSSSGIVEVPSFGIPTINIGDRQKGRIAARSVINCGSDCQDIEQKLNMILCGIECNSENPYHKIDTASNIFELIKSNQITEIKHFYDIRINDRD